MLERDGKRINLPTEENIYSERVVEYIRKRIYEVKQNKPRLQGKRKELPEINNLTDTFCSLFSTKSLWTEVDGIAFTPDIIPKSVLARKDGKEMDLNLFSVFVADMKRKILNKNHIFPIAAPNKSRHQFWDENFVRAFLLNIEFDNRHEWDSINKIAYEITPDISVDYLLEVHTRFMNDLFKKNTQNKIRRVVTIGY